jgi:PIN domain nuclease of toxin-antitoxin system
VDVSLDTCAYLYWVSGNPKLSARARAVIENPDNRIFFSAVSAMEIAIKQRAGKLSLPEPAHLYVPRTLQEHAFERLDLTVQQALHVHSMTWHHKDPFDLLLLSQCILLGMPILSDDAVFQNYPMTVIWS